MEVSQHEQVYQEMAERANYFRNIDFPTIAAAFQKAADSLRILIDTINKLNAPAPEQGKDNG